MKKILGIVGGIVVFLAVVVVVVFYGIFPRKREAPAMTAKATPEAIERGRYLATHVAGCIGCHSAVRTGEPGEPLASDKLGAGRDFTDNPDFPGRIFSPNITPHPTDGIGAWSDGEIVRAIREGVSRDGRPLFPMMAYMNYRELSDDDVLAIVAYLRTLPPIAGKPEATSIAFPVSMIVRALPKPIEGSPPPEPTDQLARGKWLLSIAGCKDCHTHDDGPDFAGGNPFYTPKGVVHSANITSDKATGIGAVSDEMLMAVFDEAKGKAAQDLYVMPSAHYKGMTEEDKRALIAAMKAIPAVENTVPARGF